MAPVALLRLLCCCFVTPVRRSTGEFSGTDCYPGIELGNCSDSHPPPYSIQECKAACLVSHEPPSLSCYMYYR